MNTASINVRYCAALVAALMTLISPGASSATMAQPVHKEMKTPGKPTAPIEVSYTVPGSVAVGSSVTVVVTIKPLADVTDLSLTITAGEGLSLSSGAFARNYGAQSHDTVFSESVTATPSANGILYLNVFAGGSFHGKTMVSASAVPISVGPSPEKMLKKSGTIERDSSGRNIAIMSAEERK